MTTRYFKATDGKKTVFRASKTRVYASANIDSASFSAKPASAGMAPTIEITKAEYDRLTVLKHARCRIDFAKYSERFIQSRCSDPEQSWVRNAELKNAA